MQRINSFAQVSKYLLTYSFAPMFAPLLFVFHSLHPLLRRPAVATGDTTRVLGRGRGARGPSEPRCRLESRSRRRVPLPRRRS